MASEKEEKFEWNSVVEQINEKIGTDIAIVDKYGMILASRVKGFEKGRLISPIFWSLIENRRKLIEQLDVSEVESFIIETDEGYMVFVFGEHIYLMSVI